MNGLILCQRFCFGILLVIAVISSAIPWGFSDIALAEQGQQELSKTESWVVDQIETGKIADLREFSNMEDRVLSAGFIENLLTGELEDAQIHRHGVSIKYAIFTEPIDLVSAQVYSDTLLTYCRFENDVDLSKSHFRSCLSLANSTFSNADAKASFYCMTVDNSANFSGTIFECPVDFESAEIAGAFWANGANFACADGKANFRHIKVEDAVLFNDAVFASTVDFSYSRIGINFEAVRAEFKGVDFPYVTVGSDVSFTSAVFEGPVYFGYSQIGNNLNADNATFLDSMDGAKFSSMTVGYRANFIGARFYGSATFDFIKIGGDFIADRAKFLHEGEGLAAIFYSMKVEGSALYTDTAFKGPVSFSYSRIGRNFETQEAVFAGALYCSSMVVGYRTNFSNANFINGPVNFRNSEFQNLIITIDEEKWQTNNITLHGMTYKSISITGKNTSPEDLIAWVDSTIYSKQAYLQLEAFFRAEGAPVLADAAFAAQKRQVREKMPKWLAWGDLILDWIVLWGRSPGRLLYGSIFFIVLGSFVFRLKRMELQKELEPNKKKKELEPNKKKEEEKRYNAFCYSLDAFIPFVNLGMESVWKPKKVSAQYYFMLHRFCGWLVIPIGLLAITAIIT